MRNCLHDAVRQWFESLKNGSRKFSAHNDINKIFSQSKTDSPIVLKEHLLNLLQTPVETLNQINETGNVINGCFDNVIFAPQVISELFADTSAFLKRSLELSLIACSSENVVSVKLVEIIHLLSRITVLVLKQQKNLSSDKLNAEMKGTLSDIAKNIGLIISYIDTLAMDTRTNFASAIWLIRGIVLTKTDFQNFVNDLTNCLITETYQDLKYSTHFCVFVSSLLFTYSEIVLTPPSVSFYLNYLIAICEKYSTETPIVLLTSRSLQTFFKDAKTVEKFELDEIFVEKIIQVLWMLLEHPVVCIRHSGRSFLSIVASQTIFQQPLLRAVLNSPKDGKIFLMGLTSLAPKLESQMILAENPHIPNALVASLNDNTIVNHVTFALKNMALNDNRIKANLSEWCHVWIDPLLLKLPNCSELVVADATKLLHSLFKSAPDALNITINKWKSEETDDALHSLLICLKIRNKLFPTRPIEDSALIERCLKHWDDEIRISALSILVDPLKPSQIYSEEDFRLIFVFLQYNLNIHNPATRQKVQAVYKQLLLRFASTSGKKNLPQYYSQFPKDLIKFCYDNLFPGANFNRCSTVLYILNLCHELKVGLTELYLPQYWPSIMVGLENSFEENKALTSTVATNFPFQDMEINDSIEDEIKRALVLIKSLEPPSVLFGTYFLKVLLNVPKSEAVLKKLSTEPDLHKNLLLLNILVNILRDQVDLSSRDLLLTPISAPMYGTLFALRNVALESLGDFVDVIFPIAQQLQLLCFQILDVVAEVVNNSSPEGHLPMDFNQFLTQEDDKEKVVVTAQALLLCSWRSSKESCLLLGQLCSILLKATTLNKDEVFNFVVKIGTRLIKLLCEIKHRGAFEQAFLAFTSLCTILRTSTDVKLNALPLQWLKQVLEEIQMPSSEQTYRLTSTRRSAGLPFLVQAVVATEVSSQPNSIYPESLKYTMDFLLESAKEDNERLEFLEKKIHSLNILRALFKHAQLGSYISSYVSKAVVLAIQGSRSDAWPIRNCSNLLFSALINRIFGVARSREFLSRKNKMTARTFFQRYPDLYDFFLEEMSFLNDNSVISGIQPKPSLFLVLIMLARLDSSYTTQNDSGEETNLLPFINYLRICTGNSILKIRLLASKAVAPLVIQHCFGSQMNLLFPQINADLIENSNQNWLHGCLLQMFWIMKEIHRNGLDVKEEELNKWIENSKGLLSPKVSPYVQHSYLELIDFLWRHQFVKKTVVQSILSAVQNFPTNLPGAILLLITTKKLKWDINCHDDNYDLKSKVWGCLGSGNFLEEEMAVRFLYRAFCPCLEKDPFSYIDQQIVDMDCLSNLENLKERLICSNVDIAFQLQRQSDSNLKKLLALVMANIRLKTINSIDTNLSDLLLLNNICKNENLSHLPFNFNYSENDFKQIYLALDELYQKSIEYRILVAKYICALYEVFHPATSSANIIGPWFLKCHLCVLAIACDEEEDVRLEVSKAIVMKEKRLLPIIVQERILQDYLNLFQGESNTLIINGLFRMAMLSLVTKSDVTVDEETGVFERGNPNPFFEPMALLRMILDKIPDSANVSLLPGLFSDINSELLPRSLNKESFELPTIRECCNQLRTSIPTTCPHPLKIFYAQLRLIADHFM